MLHDIVMKDTMMSYKKQELFILRIGFLNSEEHEFLGVQVNRKININSSWKFMIELKKSKNNSVMKVTMGSYKKHLGSLRVIYWGLCCSYFCFETFGNNFIQTTQTRHEPCYKQLGVKTNRTSFLWGNRNRHHNIEIRT